MNNADLYIGLYKKRIGEWVLWYYHNQDHEGESNDLADTTKFYIIALDGLIELAALKAKITKEFENQYNSEMPKVKHVITALKDHAGWYHKNKDQVKRSESLRQLQGFCDEAIKGVLEILIEDAENMSKIYNELKPPKPVIMVPRNGQSSQQLVITER